MLLIVQVHTDVNVSPLFWGLPFSWACSQTHYELTLINICVWPYVSSLAVEFALLILTFVLIAIFKCLNSESVLYVSDECAFIKLCLWYFEYAKPIEFTVLKLSLINSIGLSIKELAITILVPLRPLSLIDIAFLSDHYSWAMLPILIKLALIKAFLGNELNSFAWLVPLFSFLLALSKIKSPLIVPDDFLVGLRNRENETVLELLDDNALQGLALDRGDVEFAGDR